MPQIEKIRVVGYKSIRDQTLELRPPNVMIGANGAGKSNLFGVFRLLNEYAVGDLWEKNVFGGRSAA